MLWCTWSHYNYDTWFMAVNIVILIITATLKLGNNRQV